MRTLWRAGAGAVLLLLEGLREAEPGVVAGHQGVFDEEDLQDVPGDRAAEERELKQIYFLISVEIKGSDPLQSR